MKLTVLGSGTVAPTADRTAPAYWVESGPVRLLMDCGAGVLHRAARFQIPWWDVTHIAITHFHLDHWGELPAYLFALRWGTLPPRQAPLAVLGPTGLAQGLASLAAVYGPWLTAPDFPLEIVELPRAGAHRLSPEVRLATHPTPHTEESVALAVETDGARLVYTGDTGPSAELATWAAGADLLLAECSLPDELAMDIHLTPSSLAEMARAARPDRLVLTHVYPVFDADPVALVRQAYDGDVTLATDGATYTI